MSDPFGPPTFAGFQSFVQEVAGIDQLVLPLTSPVWDYAYAVATATVNCDLAAAPPAYTLAVYNLGTDRIIVYAQDQPGRTFFQDLRRTLGVNVFVPGVVASSGDAGTSASYANTPAMQRLTLAQLQNLKTPYGREYLALAQTYGPNVWGLS